jgi:hypothetical protein
MASTSTDFFSVSAQVIPVLFIAIAFEHRAFGRLDEEPEKDVLLAAARLMAFALILWGEVSALSAVSAHRGSTSEHGAVTTALIAEAVILSLEPVVAFVRAGAGAIPSRFDRIVHWALRAVLAVAGLALAVLGVLQILQSL